MLSKRPGSSSISQLRLRDASIRGSRVRGKRAVEEARVGKAGREGDIIREVNESGPGSVWGMSVRGEGVDMREGGLNEWVKLLKLRATLLKLSLQNSSPECLETGRAKGS